MGYNPRTSTFNVEDFGAVGDGTADDTAEIQAAIDAANAAGGGVVFFPSGTFIVSAPVVYYAGIRLVGAGRGVTTIKLAANTNTDVFKSYQFATLTGTTNTGGANHAGFADLSIDGNRANQTTGAGAGIRNYGAMTMIDRVFVRECRGDGIYSEWNPGVADAIADGCEPLLRGVSSHDNGGTGFNWLGAHDAIFTDCVAFSNGQYGFWPTTPASFTQCHSWTGLTAQLDAWRLEEACHLTACQGEGASGAQLRILSSDCTVTGGAFFAGNLVGGKGIVLGDSTHTPVGTRLDTRVQNCPAGSIDFTYSGGYGKTDVLLYGTTGTAVVGTPPGTDHTNLTVVGGMAGTNFVGAPGELTVTSAGGVDMVDIYALALSLVNGTDLTVYQGAYTTPVIKLHSQLGAVQPGTPSGLGGKIFSGSGSPSGVVSGTAGDFYLRTGTPGTANQRIYVCTTTGTTWSGIA